MPSATLTDVSAEGIVEPIATKGKGPRAPEAERYPVQRVGTMRAPAEGIVGPGDLANRGAPQDFMNSVGRFLRWTPGAEWDSLTSAGTTDAYSAKTGRPSAAGAWGSGNTVKRDGADLRIEACCRNAHVLDQVRLTSWGLSWRRDGRGAAEEKVQRR